MKTSVATTTFAASHTAAPTKSGRSLVEQKCDCTAAAGEDLIVTLREMTKDMQTGDANITAFQTVITNHS